MLVVFFVISIGVYGYFCAVAVEIVVKIVLEFIICYVLFEQVYFVCYDEENVYFYERFFI